MTSETTLFVSQCLARLQAGDERARDELIAAVCERMQNLARHMLNDYSRLRRWEETDDVFNSAALRLAKALKSVTPESPKHFYRLAALQIRRELKELARRHFRENSPDIQNASDNEVAANDGSTRGLSVEPADDTHDPSRLARWSELHNRVESLPENEREVFEIIWYNQVTQSEAADILGVSRRTVIRRWQAACLKLHDVVQGLSSGLE